MVEGAAEAEEYDAFIDSLLQRPDSAPKLEEAVPAQAPVQDDAPAIQRATLAPSPVVWHLKRIYATA